MTCLHVLLLVLLLPCHASALAMRQVMSPFFRLLAFLSSLSVFGAPLFHPLPPVGGDVVLFNRFLFFYPPALVLFRP